MFAEQGVEVDYLVGTMIEIPRAALTADEIAGVAEFFSFGTNDLTQMTFGISRDDAGKFLPQYLRDADLAGRPVPDRSIRAASGSSSRWACSKGRAARPDLKIGICGEHGGEPDTVKFCHRVGLDYVSLLAVPRPDRAPRRGAGGDRGARRARAREVTGARPASHRPRAVTARVARLRR